MSAQDLNDLKLRFLALANRRGIEIAEQELLSGLDPWAASTHALRRALLADLAQHANGEYFFRAPEAPP